MISWKKEQYWELRKEKRHKEVSYIYIFNPHRHCREFFLLGKLVD